MRFSKYARRWLGGIAEDLGAEIYAGFAVRSVRGVVTHDAGLTHQRTKSPRFEPGVAFRARATLLGEDVRGSLSKSTISMYNLRARAEAQTYGWGCRRCGACHWIGTSPGGRSGGRMKHHPHFRALLAAPGAERLGYGARTLIEAGLVTLPE
ncbi:hypothetical protein DFH09DRAFT_1316465 [Mycena vulgaris]|nr:hypothetical protein DFH09DRAFT_1316465 [Mycena vulgaris]